MPIIAISQYQFNISDPYREGHVMGTIGANVLNYHRADLIRRIAAKWVKDAEKEAPDGVLTIDMLDQLTHKITKLDIEYQLTLKPSPRESQFTQELESIAFGILRKEGKHNPIDMIRMQEIMSRRDVREKARELLIVNFKATQLSPDEDLRI